MADSGGGKGSTLRALLVVSGVLVVLAGASVAAGLSIGRLFLPKADWAPFGPKRERDPKDLQFYADSGNLPLTIVQPTVVLFDDRPRSDAAPDSYFSADTYEQLARVARAEGFEPELRAGEGLQVLDPDGQLIFGLPRDVSGPGVIVVAPGAQPELFLGFMDADSLRAILRRYRPFRPSGSDSILTSANAPLSGGQGAPDPT